MQLIECPWCGPREETEFHYGGQAHVAYPDDPAALTDEEWAHYLFFRDNPKGLFAERWSHSAGCRRWFNAVRDTATYRFHGVYRPDEQRPAISMNAPFRTAAGGRIDRDTTLRLHLRRPRLDRAPRRHARLGAAGQRRAPGHHQHQARPPARLHRGVGRGHRRSGPDRGTRSPSRCCWRPPSSCSTGWSRAASPGQGRLAEIADTASTTPPTRTPTCWSSARAGRAGRRADRGPRRGAGRADRRADRSRRRPARQHRHASTAGPPRTGSPTPSPTGDLPRGAAPAAHHRVRPLRRRLRPRAASGAPTTSAPRPRPASAGSGSGGSAPGTSWSPTGAHERPVVFADNDRPGIMLAARRPHVPAPLRRPGRRAGRRVHHQRQRLRRRRSTCTTPACGSTRSSTPAPTCAAGLRDECAARGIAVRAGAVVSGTRRRRTGHRTRWSPARRVTPPRTPSHATCCWSAAAGTRRCTCSARPAARCATTTPSARSCPASNSTAVSVAGSANGVFDLPGCLRERPRGGRGGARRARVHRPSRTRCRRADPVRREPRRRLVLWRVPDADDATRQFVDVQRDATVADLVRAVGAGMRSMEHIKRYTTIGTAHDQGKTSGVVAVGHHRRTARRADRRPRHHHVPAALHAGGVRRARRPRPRRAVRPGARDRGARLARRARRGVRGRRAVEAAAVLPAPRRGHGRRRAARMRARSAAASA